MSDPSAEADRLSTALRARGYAVFDVPLSLLMTRVAVQRPALILLDIDAEAAVETAQRLRELPGGTGIHLIFLGDATRTLAAFGEALRRMGAGVFARPIDVGTVVQKVETLVSPSPGQAEQEPIGTSSVPAEAAGFSSAPAGSLSSPPLAGTRSSPPEGWRESGGRPSVPVPPPRTLEPARPAIPPSPLSQLPLPSLSPDVEQLLQQAEQQQAKDSGSAVPLRTRPPSHPPSPEDEVDAVLPAEILAALDEPIDDEEDDIESEADLATGGGKRRSTSVDVGTSSGRAQVPSGAEPAAHSTPRASPGKGRQHSTDTSAGAREHTPVTTPERTPGASVPSTEAEFPAAEGGTNRGSFASAGDLTVPSRSARRRSGPTAADPLHLSPSLTPGEAMHSALPVSGPEVTDPVPAAHPRSRPDLTDPIHAAPPGSGEDVTVPLPAAHPRSRPSLADPIHAAHPRSGPDLTDPIVGVPAASSPEFTDATPALLLRQAPDFADPVLAAHPRSGLEIALPAERMSSVSRNTLPLTPSPSMLQMPPPLPAPPPLPTLAPRLQPYPGSPIPPSLTSGSAASRSTAAGTPSGAVATSLPAAAPTSPKTLADRPISPRERAARDTARPPLHAHDTGRTPQRARDTSRPPPPRARDTSRPPPRPRDTSRPPPSPTYDTNRQPAQARDTSRPPARDTSRPPPPAASPRLPEVIGPGDAIRAVALCIQQRATGAVCIDSAEGVRRILLRDGDVVTASSGIDDESLVGFLAARGDIPKEIVSQLQGKIPAFGRLAASALSAKGHISQDQLWPVLRAHAESIVGCALLTQKGTAAFELEPPGRLKAEPSVFGGATGSEIFVEVVKRVIPPHIALARVGGPASVVVEGPRWELLSECALSDPMLHWIESSKGASIEEVLAETPVSESEPMLYALSELGVLTMMRADEEAPDFHANARAKPRAVAELSDTLDAQALRTQVATRLQLIQEADYFTLLGVPRSATSYEVHRAYLDLRRAFSPTQVLTAATADLADDLQLILEVLEEAHDVLRDTVRRERYRRAIEGEPPT